jgi:pyruvate formate lyase activating enzyme
MAERGNAFHHEVNKMDDLTRRGTPDNEHCDPLEGKAVCQVCWRHCVIRDGERGFCGARSAKEGIVFPANYGQVTSLALDPIEKKPFAFFKRGTMILSVGSYGCNMRCPFCQNHEIARGDDTSLRTVRMSPEEVVEKAVATRTYGNIGIAFTYNEPLVGYEFVRDTAKLARQKGLETAVVTNGQIEEAPLEELLPLITAWNIDLKAFTEDNYRKLGGRLHATQRTIERAAAAAHVEVTTLVVPGLSDDESDMRREAEWLASINRSIPLHLSRYFPRFHFNKPATPIATLKKLKAVAQESLDHVLIGNV